jgi:glycoside/pentoside/hexuronide:cation symporter, GPH family
MHRQSTEALPAGAAQLAPAGLGQIAAESAPASGERLPLRERLSYGLGDFGSGLYWQAFTVYLTYFYTDVFGLSALAAGTLLGTSRSADALFDPLIGAMADRTRTRWGKFRPYLLWLSGPLALAGVLTFTVPDVSAVARLAWAWVTFNVLMLLYTAVNIPYTALLAVLSPDPAERTALASVKFVFAFAAGLLISAGVLPLCRALGGDDVASGWQRCFALVGGLATLSFVVTFLNTRERVQPAPQQATNLRSELRDLLTNRPWILLTAYSLLLNLGVAVRGAVSVHYIKYYVGAQSTSWPAFLPAIGGTRSWPFEELVAAFSVGAGLASVCGVVCVPALARAVGRKPAFLGLSALSLATLIGIYWVRPEQVGVLFTLNLVGVFAGSPLSPLLWSMYADTVDYAEWKNGRRSTGLVFATAIFASKQGWALGAIVALGLMSSLGFVANTAQSAQSLHGLVLLWSLIPAAFFALGVLAVVFYPLDERRVAQIGRELNARRAERSEQA